MTAKKTAEEFETVVETLRDKRRLLVATHIYPDGDALGSQLGLGEVLESLGKQVFYYSEKPVPHLYDFLPGCDRLSAALPPLESFDAAVAVDCGDRFRLGRNMEQLLTCQPFVAIDHHTGHKNFGTLRWVEPRRSSTAEMIYDLAVALGAGISYNAAYNLYTAIVSDSGSFKYESTSAYTFKVAGALLESGINPAEVAGKLFDNFTVNRLHLLEAVLGTLELHAGDRIALIAVTGKMLEQTGARQEDTEDFINFPRALNSVEAAAFVKETKEGTIAVSLRAKGRCDVAGVARRFGGGGHRNAAGFRLEGQTVTEVKEQLLPVIRRELEQGRAGE